MRIISGEFRGRALATVGKGDAGAHLRPTTDRVRESLFSVLTSTGAIPAERVLDLFAGTGALGLEALSRGAQHVAFVDDGRVAHGLIRKNVDICRAGERSQLLRRSVLRLGQNPDAPYDLLFLDPPYGKGLGSKALAAAQAGGWIAPGAVIVWEEGSPQDAPAGYSLLDRRKYGDTHIVLLRAPGQGPAEEAGLQPALPQLVIFDCDGVLVDSEHVFAEVLSADLADRGLRLTPQEILASFTGLSMPEVARRAQEMGAGLPADWIDLLYETAYERLRLGVPMVEGVSDVIAALDEAGIPCCVASNGSEEKMRITLGPHGLWDRFHPDALFSAHTLQVAKPDPGLFLAAARAFGIAPEACLVVEDSQPGARAARRAGMGCIGYAAHGDGAHLQDEGAEVISDMAQLAARLRAAG